MAAQAQGPKILEVALPAAFGHGKNVIGIPKSFTSQPFQAPVREQPEPMRSPGASQAGVGGAGVYLADCADAVVSEKYLLAEIARVRAEAPFADAPVRAEGEPAFRHFEGAPAAQRTSIRPLGQAGAIHETAGHGARGAHVQLS